MAESGHSPAERSSRTTVTRHASSIGQWEVAVASAGPVVRHYAREYVGWMEHMKAPLVRRELPTEQAPLIFNFGAPIRLFDLRDPARHTDVGSFITGAYDRTQLVGSAGPSGGVQVNLTLLGIRTLVGRPIADMKNRAVSVEDVFGRSLRSLSDQLAGARTWEARFALMDRVLIARLADRGDIPAGVRCAWHRLMSSGGRAPIASIVQETGWSQKHLIERFHQELGVSPKGTRPHPSLWAVRPGAEGRHGRVTRGPGRLVRVLRSVPFASRRPRVCRDDPGRARGEPAA